MKWFLIFFTALAVRLILVPNPGFHADISFWKSWSIAPFDHGILWAAYNTNNNYPTPFAYVLLGMAWLYSRFADIHDFSAFWTHTNTWFLFVAKLPSIVSDFGIAAVILWLEKHAKRVHFPNLPFSLYALLAVFYLFNPVTLIDGAVWGQVDSLGVFLFLLAFVMVLTGRPFLAGFVYVTAMMMKLQNMIYGPLFFLFLWQYMGYGGLVRGIAGAILAFFGLNIEFFLTRDMGRVIRSLTENYDYFPLLSLNAYNLWWIVAGGDGMHVSDKIAAIGIINVKTMGLILFSTGYLLGGLTMAWPMFIRMIANKKEEDDTPLTRQELVFRFLTGLTIVASSFFLLQANSHDRYAFPVSVCILLFLPFFIAYRTPLKNHTTWWRTKPFHLFCIFYTIFSLVYFYNLHTALIVNYPENGIPFLVPFSTPTVTIPASYILLGLFGIFLIAIRFFIGGVPLALAMVFLAAGLIIPNMPLIMKKPIALSKLTPTISRQDYGVRVTDMPVNAWGESKTWNRLSVQYAFYRKGIGTHANSYIVYDINRNFKRFTTDYGIDTEAGNQGTAVFAIYGDKKLLFQSEKIGRFELPRHANVDVTGVKNLELVVTDAGDGINDDHADWLRPTLWP